MKISVSKTDEKSGLTDGFQYDLTMTLDSGLLFLGHPVCIPKTTDKCGKDAACHSAVSRRWQN